MDNRNLRKIKTALGFTNEHFVIIIALVVPNGVSLEVVSIWLESQIVNSKTQILFSKTTKQKNFAF